MLKIQIFDSWNGKFSSAIRQHWEQGGHAVIFNGPHFEQDPADIGFFYQADNAAQVGVKECNAKRIFVQAVDVEVWAGQADVIDWSRVSGCITMAQHISDKVKTPPDVVRTLIKPGIDLNKFTLSSHDKFKDPIRRIAYVVGDGRIWDVKRLDIALQLLFDIQKMRPEVIWQLHIRGTYSGHVQYNAYCNHLIKSLGLENNVVWTDRVDDLNKWLDDKHFFLLPSTKEAFSYATAEAMAKGLKPILNNWESAEETWQPFYSKSYLEMLEGLCTDPSSHDSETYRSYITDKYNQEVYFKRLDEFMGIGGDNV